MIRHKLYSSCIGDVIHITTPLHQQDSPVPKQHGILNLKGYCMNQEIMYAIIKFRDDRNWKQYHNPKDLAISLSLEASELLENFQWSSSSEAVLAKKENICDELADVLMYSVLLADTLGVDINEIVQSKLQKNALKYPVEKAYGKKEKYTEL